VLSEEVYRSSQSRDEVERTRSVHFMVPTKIRESVVWMRRVLLRRWWRYSVASALESFIVCCVSMIVQE
jgi:hypothetical protein